jgi:hypothetical protein
MVCQRTYKNADHPGYLQFGVPAEYGAGTSEAIRAMVQLGVPKQQLITERLRLGDIERALLEWRSLLRHVAHAPDHDWDRWMQFKETAIKSLHS